MENKLLANHAYIICSTPGRTSSIVYVNSIDDTTCKANVKVIQRDHFVENKITFLGNHERSCYATYYKEIPTYEFFEMYNSLVNICNYFK